MSISLTQKVTGLRFTELCIKPTFQLRQCLSSAQLLNSPCVSLLLLQRTDTDRSLQDFEGYTAFDLYNLTVNGTKPGSGDPFAELFTWGANR